MSKTQAECAAKWETTKALILEAINAIDKDTPFSDIEPKWWREMMAVRKAATK